MIWTILWIVWLQLTTRSVTEQLKHLYLYYFTFLFVRFAQQTVSFIFSKFRVFFCSCYFYDYTFHTIKRYKLFSVRKETFVKNLSESYWIITNIIKYKVTKLLTWGFDGTLNYYHAYYCANIVEYKRTIKLAEQCLYYWKQAVRQWSQQSENFNSVFRE